MLADSLEELIEQRVSEEAEDLTLFERAALGSALENGSVGQSDYEEGMGLYLECMTIAGYEIQTSLLSNGIIRTFPPDGLSDDTAVDSLMSTNFECLDSTALAVIEIYEIQQGNPELLMDPMLVIRNCLVNSGLVPESFTADDASAVVHGSGAGSASFDVMAEPAQTCFYSAGAAVYIAD